MSTTNNLESLIEQTMTQYHEYEEQQKQKALEMKRRKEEEAERVLRLLLGEALSPEFLASTSFSYRHVYESYDQQHSVRATFPYLGAIWELQYQGGGNGISHSGWRISTNLTYRGSPVETEHLQTRLLVEMGKYREEVLEKERKETVWNLHIEEQQRKRAEQDAKEAEERRVRIEEADSEHERLLPFVQKALAKAEKEQWHWPQGITIELYYVEWCKGAMESEDGADFDYDGGWTTSMDLDAQNCVQIAPMKRYSWSTDPDKGRTVRLIPEVHRPTWTIHHFSSTEDLPELLQQEATFNMPGIATYSSYQELDGKERFIEAEDRYTKSLGTEPLTWIQALVDHVAREQ